jgi:hypothetical protein
MLFGIARNTYAIYDNDKSIIGFVGFDGTFIPVDDPNIRKAKKETGLHKIKKTKIESPQ